MADKTINNLQIASKASLDNQDSLMMWNHDDGSTRQVLMGQFFTKSRENVQGYYSLLTNFYYTGGAATETEFDEDDINDWYDVNFTTDAQGVFDYRPQSMKDASSDPFDDSTKILSLEGLTLASSVIFRASMTFEPDEDEGELQARLLFNRHSGTTPSNDFSIEDVALSMSNGADIEYPAEPTLTFFVGDTIDTNGVNDAGKCRFQIKTSVPGTVRMRALSWYISQ